MLSAGCKNENSIEANPSGELELISAEYVEPGIKWGLADVKGDITLPE